MAQAPRTNAGHDQNRVPTLIGVSTTDGTTPVPAEVDPTTGQLQVSSTGSGGGAATIADGADIAQGTTTDVAYVSGSGTIVAILKGIFGKFGTLGQKNMAGSAPVTIASDQSLMPVNQSQVAGNTTSVGVGASGTGTQRVVQANDSGKTIVSKGGSAASSGDNTLQAAGTNKLKVFRMKLTTTSTTAMTCKITDGAAGTVLDQVILQAPTSVNVGYAEHVSPPAYLYATSAATALILNLSSANAVHYSFSYFDES